MSKKGRKKNPFGKRKGSQIEINEEKNLTLRAKMTK